MLIENVLKSSWSECGYQDEYNCSFFIQNWQENKALLCYLSLELHSEQIFTFVFYVYLLT